jgi:thiol-disulfide isomerase/thioredoxin
MNGSVWIATYVLLWLAVLVLSIVVVALLRQVGVLHARMRPMGVHFAGEGPERLEPAPGAASIDYSRNALTLIAFTSPTCEICKELMPSLEAIRREYSDLQYVQFDHGPDSPMFLEFNVRSTPYVVTVDRDGIVQGRGVANSLEQVEELIAESIDANTLMSTPVVLRSGAGETANA